MSQGLFTRVLAMEAAEHLVLEDKLKDLKEGQKVDIMAEILIRCPDHHVCRSAVLGQTFITNAVLTSDHSTFSLLGATLLLGGRHPWLQVTKDTHVIQHAGIDVANMNTVIETCAGIGAVSTAMPFCGASTSVYVEQNVNYCNWLKQRTDTPVIHGDVADPFVVKLVSELTGEIPQPISGGFSCQPFSALGDRREQKDPRSRTLPALLRMAFHLRSPVVTLECTKEAFDSPWVQQQLSDFCDQTGFKLAQTTLHLHTAWPAFRTRWWACLTHPCLGNFVIPPMPQHQFCPATMHVMPVIPHVHPVEQKQLDLDRYELRHFHSQPNGIAASIINTSKPLPTATHAWGSQLSSCPCGCRSAAFCMQRLTDKGLYGVLVPLGTFVESGNNHWHGMRHLHPREVAIFNGLDPRYVESNGRFSLKFELTGVGQMASPLQGAWVFSNVMFQIAKAGFPINAEAPRHVIATMCRELIRAKAVVWPNAHETRFVDAFMHEITRLDTPVDESPSEQQHTMHDLPGHEVSQVTSASHSDGQGVSMSEPPSVMNQVALPHTLATEVPDANQDRQETSMSLRGRASRSEPQHAEVASPHMMSNWHDDTNSVRSTAVGLPLQYQTEASDSIASVMNAPTCRAHHALPNQSTDSANPVYRDAASCTDSAADRLVQTCHSVQMQPMSSQCSDISKVAHMQFSQAHVLNTELSNASSGMPVVEQAFDHRAPASHTEGMFAPPSTAMDSSGQAIPVYIAKPTRTDHRSTSPEGEVIKSNARPTTAVPAAMDNHSKEGNKVQGLPQDLQSHDLPGMHRVYHDNGAVVTFFNIHQKRHPVTSQHAESGWTEQTLSEHDSLMQNDPWIGKQLPAKSSDEKGNDFASAKGQHNEPLPRAHEKGSSPDKEATRNEESIQKEAQDAYEDMLQAYAKGGGIANFSSNKRKPDHLPDNVHTDTKKAKSTNTASAMATPAYSHQTPNQMPDALSLNTKDDQKDESADEAQIHHVTAVIGHPQERLYEVAVPKDTTVGQLVSAEAKLHGLPPPTKAISVIGTDIPVYQVVQHQQVILLEDGRTFQPSRCPQASDSQMPNIEGLERLTALWSQRGWVATDEMSYYLKMLQVQDFAITTEPLVFTGRLDDADMLGEWIMRAAEKAIQRAEPTRVLTACLWGQHWFPISATFQHDTVIMHTTVNEKELVANWIDEALEFPIQCHAHIIGSNFNADCGFQALAWIMNKAAGETAACPMTVQEAIKWRMLFAMHLHNQGSTKRIVHDLQLGGMIAEDHIQEVAKLLTLHGVDSDRVPVVVQQLVRQVGHPNLKTALGSARPWADLKARASACKPPIQLVLASELQAKIAERLQTGMPMGNKKNKAPKKQGTNKWVTPAASQVQIPPGIFQQQDGTPLSQVSINEIQAKQRGVVVLNIQDAQPYLNLQAPLSKEGIGLLILEFQSDLLPAQHQIIKFPANCPDTQEPMIITAALVQIGGQSISRSMPAQPAGIEQIDTKVLRVVLYRDQHPHQWDAIASNSVKALLAMEHFATLEPQDILDVWDRQYLNKQYQKVRPDQAEIFSVVLRMAADQVPKLMTHNSVEGVYFEPRTQSGRAPSPSHRIVWLPKKTYADTMVAQQATQITTSIARSGDRFGLRVIAEEAQLVHQQHRPDVAYIDGSSTKQYRISPLPFGTTKKSLQQVFATWGWNARASHTQGLTPDKQGLVWVALAAEPPSYWVFTMTHGDVLINEQFSQKPMQMQQVGAPVASHKTLKHLTATAKTQRGEDTSSQVDPWLAQDPWSAAAKAQMKQPAPSASQLATMEANLHKRVMAAVHEKITQDKQTDMDTEASNDTRVAQLEQQVSMLTGNMQQLTGSFTEFKHQQTTHNNQVAHQVQTLKQQADQQQHTMQNLLEQKMEEQMLRIEALLTNKRPKTNE